jgi:ABC-type Fe3+/spermidine/putrescine transport system ATPase subunit/ABC-type sulfate transport system permease component
VQSAPGLGGALATSLVTATVSAALIALLGIPLAYLLARSRSRWASALSVLVALPLALPPLMSGILLLYLVGPYTALGRLTGGQLTDTRVGIVLAQTFVAAPFLIVAARGAFASVDPDLDEMARALGHRRLARFVRVWLPAAWPGVLAGILLAWLRSFGEFGATVILAYHPYTLPVFTFVQFDGTGLPGTMLPLAAALGCALLVLAAVHVRARRRRPRARRPAARAPRMRVAAGPDLRLRARGRLGPLGLDVRHAGASRRLAILGPSGAGKTLTLRVLAGLAPAQEVALALSGEDLAALPAEERDLGYMPQRSALLPRRTVWEQLMFPAGADACVASWWLERLGLEGLEDRLPEELSGGQRRRVALARALARDPALVLLDEPFSALDAPVRAELQRELRRLQHEADLASIIVTHEPEEAALLADELIVIDAGRVLQQGPVEDVMARPASPRVAALLRIPNVFRGVVAPSARTILTGPTEVDATACGLAPGTPVMWTVSPGEVRLDADRVPGGVRRGTVLDCVRLAHFWQGVVDVGGLELTFHAAPGSCVPPGAQVGVAIGPESVSVWPAPDSGDVERGARRFRARDSGGELDGADGGLPHAPPVAGLPASR